jgi:pSer/pThr/pTyr-binding forkhead associated (FHA) protein
VQRLIACPENFAIGLKLRTLPTSLAFAGDLVLAGDRRPSAPGSTMKEHAPTRLSKAPRDDARARETTTTPESLLGATNAQPGLVTALLLRGSDTIYPLPTSKTTWVLGADASTCDLVLASPYLSRRHCRLTRTEAELRVSDLQSKNGTYVDGAKARRPFVLRAGRSFTVGASLHQFLALNEAMRTRFPELTDILGEPEEHVLRSETPSPADLVVAAQQGGHLLIASAPHCEQARLAQLIHELSPFSTTPLVTLTAAPRTDAQQRAFLSQHRKSTVVLDLGDAPLDPDFVSNLFAWRSERRMIVLVRSLDAADRALGERVTRGVRHIWLPRLAMRTAAIDRLFDRALAAQDSPLRLAAMTPANQAALRAYTWPDDFASLRLVAERLAEIARAGSPNGAYEALGMKRATLYDWYVRTMGLSHPLTT